MGTLFFDKGSKNIERDQYSLSNKWCWENWTATGKRMKLAHFLAPIIAEAVFAPLYILASFVKNKTLVGAWAFYPVPLVYFSVFVPVP